MESWGVFGRLLLEPTVQKGLIDAQGRQRCKDLHTKHSSRLSVLARNKGDLVAPLTCRGQSKLTTFKACSISDGIAQL